VDPTLKEDIENDTADKIEVVKKELAWVSKKESFATEKLRQKFLMPVKTERIEVQAIDVRSGIFEIGLEN
jgi:hypothetical protein